MGGRLRWVVAGVVVMVAMLGRPADGQILSDRLPPLPAFDAVRRDLDAAGVDVDPNALAIRYAELIARWCDEQVEARNALAKAVGTDFEVVASPEEVERAVAAVRRSRAAHGARLEAFWEALAGELPETARPGLETVRGWWRVDAERPGESLEGFARAEDVGALVRRFGLPAERRDAIVAALAKNASARREAFRRFDRAVSEGYLAAARLAAEKGWIGRELRIGSDDPGIEAIFRELWTARRPDPASLAEVFATQLAAFDEVAPALPPAIRRSVFDELVRQHMGDQMHGSGIRLPALGADSIPLNAPAQVGQAILAGDGLEDRTRTAAREEIGRWIEADDAIVRAYFAERITLLRAGEWPPSFQLPTEVQGQRCDLAATHVATLATITGAEWLTRLPTNAPALDAKRLTDADRAVVGAPGSLFRFNATRASRPPELSLLPRDPAAPTTGWAGPDRSMAATFVEPMVARVRGAERADGAAESLDAEQARSVLAELVRVHREAWAARVGPEVAAAEAADRRAIGPEARGSRFEDREASIDLGVAHRRAAFEQSRSVDRELMESVRAALGDELDAASARWNASRRWREGVELIGNDRSSDLDLERMGGGLVDLAGVVEAAQIPLTTKRAIETALVEEWSGIAAAAVETLELRLSVQAAERRAQVTSRESWQEEARERSATLRRAADQWRALEDRLLPRMIDVAGAAAPALARAVRERQFGSAYYTSTELAALCTALAAGPEFAGRTELIATLERIRVQADLLAEQRVALSLPRQPVADIDSERRWKMDDGRGFRGMDLLLGAIHLNAAADWLVSVRVPAEIAAASPALDRAIRRVQDRAG